MWIEKISPSEKHLPRIEKSIQEFFECLENCKNISDITKVLIDIDLFQKEHQDTLGRPWIPHSEQSEGVLSNELYWKISNIKKSLVMRKEIIDNWLKEFASFSVWWSIGVGYLWYILAQDEHDKLPEVIFWASAGSLFPILYLLWKEALRTSPKDTKPWMEWLISYLPQNLWNKTMWSDGEELIQEFKKSANKLIDIINQKRWEPKMLPIDKISIGDISKSFWIIASRKKPEWWYQEVIFSWWDNLMDAVIASSNPEINILWINFSVLTSSRNKFLWNVWHDGDHTNYNPLNYWEILGLDRKTQVIALPFFQKWSDRFSKVLSSQSYKSMSSDERVRLLEETSFTTFPIPSSLEKLLISTENKSDYKISDQNTGWSIETMSYRVKIAYIQWLILGVRENQDYYKSIWRVLDKITSVWLKKEERDSVIWQYITFLWKTKNSYSEKEREEFEITRDNVAEGYNLAKKIVESNGMSNDQKQNLIKVIFYKDYTLINPRLSSQLLPIFLPGHSREKSDIDHFSSKYTPDKLSEILRTWKLPLDYFLEDLRWVRLWKSFIQNYNKIKNLAPDDFYKLGFRALADTLDPVNLIEVIVYEPQFRDYILTVAEHTVANPPLPYYLSENLASTLSLLISKIQNDKIKDWLRKMYEALRQKNIEILQERIDELKKLPKL